MLCIDEMVTRVEIATVFDDGNTAARLAQDAQRMLLPKGRPGSLFKDLYLDPANVLAHPLVKDGTEKKTKRFGGHGVAADAALGIGLWLDQGQKGDGLRLELLEEPVHLEGNPDVVGVHHTEDFARHVVPLQELVATDCLLKGGFLVLGDAVQVVQRLRTVEADPNGKPLCRQETAPLLVEQGAVGLDAVRDAPVGRLVLMLQGHKLTKIIQPQDARFPTMPGKADHRIGARVDVLDNVRLQDVVGHNKRRVLRIEALLVQIVAVVAAQVADSAGGFGENLECAGSLGHVGAFFHVTVHDYRPCVLRRQTEGPQQHA